MARAGGKGAAEAPAARASVAVVIPTFEHAHYLDEALRSVFAQTRPADEVIVVDDGSRDDPAAVAARYPQVRLIRQANAGLAAARNTGLAASAADFVIFLDADDRLLPPAVEAGLACHAAQPGAGFVYGAHRRVDAELRPLTAGIYTPCGSSAYRALLKRNLVGSCAAVMFDRGKLAECGGFEPGLKRCEDYDAYLRMAMRFPVACHQAVVTDYRIHGENMSSDPLAMLHWALVALDRNRPPADDPTALAAYREGRRRWRFIYALAAWRPGGKPSARLAVSARAPAASASAAAVALARRIVPEPLWRRLRARLRRQGRRVGEVNMGDLATTRPVSRRFGFDRGTPVDRWYIERFLARHAADIRGRVLEIGDAGYSRRLGSDITGQDVFDRPGGPAATLTGDLTVPGTLPEKAFDCLVVTQVLQFLYDIPAAVAELQRSLAPSGVLLLTVPGVTSIDPSEGDGVWYWSLTGQAAARLFGEAFGPANVEVTVYGNVYAATCFLQGLAVEETDTALLEQDDPAYPMLVCVRAQRAD